jgi:hypothetical protein
MARTVRLTEDAARRMAAATRAYERGNRDQSAIMFRQGGDDGGDPVRLGKTTAAWNKGTTATIELFEEGTPPSEGKKTPADTLTNCVNKFANVATGKWVIVARGGNGYWYLIAAEC